MKRYIAITLLAIVSLLFYVPDNVQAQSYNVTTIAAGSTANIASPATNTTYASTVIYAGKAQNVGLLLSFKAISAATGTIDFVIDKSIDNSNWDLAVKTFTMTANGTTTVTLNTNFSTAPYGYWRIGKIVDTNSVALTNLVIKYSVQNGL